MDTATNEEPKTLGINSTNVFSDMINLVDTAHLHQIVTDMYNQVESQGLELPISKHLLIDLSTNATVNTIRSLGEHVEQAHKLAGTSPTQALYIATVVNGTVRGALSALAEILNAHARKNVMYDMLKSMGLDDAMIAEFEASEEGQSFTTLI